MFKCFERCKKQQPKLAITVALQVKPTKELSIIVNHEADIDIKARDKQINRLIEEHRSFSAEDVRVIPKVESLSDLTPPGARRVRIKPGRDLSV
jgi:hypothetical protein